MALEPHALLMDLAELAQREHLEAAAVSEDVAVPVAEIMKPVKCLQDLHTRTQVQMICVAQYDLRFYVILKFRHLDSLNRTHRADRHEDGCLNHTMAGNDLSGSGMTCAVCVLQFKNQSFQYRIIFLVEE